jgi:hypothetical protein
VSIDFRKPSSISGYEIAERLGVEAWFDMSGDHGSVFLLEDGRAMKTCGEHDAALALALMRSDVGHPSVPAVHQVVAFEQTIDLTELGHGNVQYRSYAIIRDGFDDPHDERFESTEWKQAVSMLNHGWSHDEPEYVERALEAWHHQGAQIEQILAGLHHIREVTGVRVFDIRPSNIGVSPSRSFGMRDLGKSNIESRSLMSDVRELKMWTAQEDCWISNIEAAINIGP